MTIPFGDLIDLFKKMQSGGMKLDENTMKSFIEFRKTNPNDFKELSNRVMRGYKLYGMNNADTSGAEDTNLQAVSSGNVMNAPVSPGEQGMPRNGATPAESARLAVHTQNVDDATGMQGMKRISILPVRAEQAAARSLYSGQGMPNIDTAQSAPQYAWQAKNGQGASGQAAYGNRDELNPSEVNETDDQKKDQIEEYMQELLDGEETDWQTSISPSGGFLSTQKYCLYKTYIKITPSYGGKLQATLYSADNNVLADLGLYDGDNLKTAREEADSKAQGILKEIALSNAVWSGLATQDAGTDPSSVAQPDTATAESQSTANTNDGKATDTNAASGGSQNEPDKPADDSGWKTVNFTGGME